jgi:hypothetical protein
VDCAKAGAAAEPSISTPADPPMSAPALQLHPDMKPPAHGSCGLCGWRATERAAACWLNGETLRRLVQVLPLIISCITQVNDRNSPLKGL